MILYKSAVKPIEGFRMCIQAGFKFIPMQSLRKSRDLTVSFSVCFALFFAAGTVNAQWEEDVLLVTANDSVRTADSNGRSIAAQGDFVHALWSAKEDGKWRTSYRRSVDKGRTWEEIYHLTEPNTLWPPHNGSLAVQDSDVYAVWQDERVAGLPRVYFRRSTDYGETWGTETAIGSAGGQWRGPSIVCDGDVLHVAYVECFFYGVQQKVLYTRSTDRGATWEPAIVLSDVYADEPCLAVSGSVVHVCYTDYWESFLNPELGYRRSTDRGKTWEQAQRLTNDRGITHGCTMAVSGDDVHIAWDDRRTEGLDVYYVRSSDGGRHWGAERPITQTTYNCYYPTLAVDGQTLHLAWRDTRVDNGDIYSCRSDDAGRSWSTAQPIVTSPSRSTLPSLCVSGQALHLLWTDYPFQIHYRRNPTGNTGATATQRHFPAAGYSIEQNHPNPFDGNTQLRYTLPSASQVMITVHDMFGRTVHTVVNDYQAAGSHIASLHGRNLPGGSYLCRMQAGNVVLSRMMTVLRE